MDESNLVLISSIRRPYRAFRQVSWEDLERATTSFGEVPTRNVFVQTEPTHPTGYAPPIKEDYAKG
jgi:hypothetical protein